MGMKSSPQMPPPIDKSVIDRTAEKEAKLEVEKNKMLATKEEGSIRYCAYIRYGR